MKRVIVGLDPGTTVGLALLSFYNTPLLLLSRKGMSEDEIIKTVLSHGKPVVVATDVPRPPEKVERLARQLGAVIFAPGKELAEKEKERIAALYGVKVDAHVRDALAAAYLAYQHYRPKIERVLRKLREEEFVEGLIEKVIKGTQTVRALEEEFLVRGSAKQSKKRERDRSEIKRLRGRIGELQEERKRLLKRIDELQKRLLRRSEGELITMLEAEVERLRKERDEKSKMVTDLEKKVRKLEADVEVLRVFVERVRQAVKEGLLIGSKELVEGVEIAPGVYAGKRRKGLGEKIRELVEEYREARRKELNVL